MTVHQSFKLMILPLTNSLTISLSSRYMHLTVQPFFATFPRIFVNA